VLDFHLPDGLLTGEPPFWFAVVGGSGGLPSGYDGVPRPGRADADTRVLVLEPADEDDAFLCRYDSALGSQGDGYFSSREEAVAAVEEEFGERRGGWHPIPEDVDHPETFALRAACTAAE
jgi:hypothetical protein